MHDAFDVIIIIDRNSQYHRSVTTNDSGYVNHAGGSGYGSGGTRRLLNENSKFKNLTRIEEAHLRSTLDWYLRWKNNHHIRRRGQTALLFFLYTLDILFQIVFLMDFIVVQ